MAGLTSTGFESKRFADILTDIKARLRSTFGSGVDTDEDSAVMQIVSPIALEISETWDGTALLYDMFNPNAAEGIALDNIGALTNTTRIDGSHSTVTVQATGTEGAIISAGFQRAVQDTQEIFETTSEQTLPATGSQPLEFTMTAVNEGPIACIAGTLNQGTLPSGVTSIVNAVDAELGTLEETDEEYRVSRKSRLQSLGAGTVVAIKATLSEVSNVTDVVVLENDTDVIDSNGQAPHSIRAIVQGGADQDIIDAIGETKPAGTTTVGSETGTFTDETDGQTFTINFDRVSGITMYVTVTVTSKDSNYPATGDQDIEDALLALTWDVGEDVVLPKLQNAVTSIPGIITYTLYFDTSASPSTDTTITIGVGEIADFDSTRITVTS